MLHQSAGEAIGSVFVDHGTPNCHPLKNCEVRVCPGFTDTGPAAAAIGNLPRLYPMRS